MKGLKVASDLLLVLAVILVVVAIVVTIKVLFLLAAAAFVGSVALTVAKRSAAKKRA